MVMFLCFSQDFSAVTKSVSVFSYLVIMFLFYISVTIFANQAPDWFYIQRNAADDNLYARGEQCAHECEILRECAFIYLCKAHMSLTDNSGSGIN